MRLPLSDIIQSTSFTKGNLLILTFVLLQTKYWQFNPQSIEDREMEPSFFISPATHIYCDLSKELSTLDMEGANSHAIHIRELVNSFKRKSFLMNTADC